MTITKTEEISLSLSLSRLHFYRFFSSLSLFISLKFEHSPFKYKHKDLLVIQNKLGELSVSQNKPTRSLFLCDL